MKLFNCFLVLSGSFIYAMGQENAERPTSLTMVREIDDASISPSKGIILVSNKLKEFVVNEESIQNISFLQQNRSCNINKILTKHTDEVVEFLAQVINNPLYQNELIRNKITELQEVNNDASLAEYTMALKEFGISIWQAVQEIPVAPQPLQMVTVNQNNTRQVERLNSAQQRCILDYSCHCKVEERKDPCFPLLCSFKIFSWLQEGAYLNGICGEKRSDGKCYVCCCNACYCCCKGSF